MKTLPRLVAIGALLMSPLGLFAQAPVDEEDLVVMNPFVVESEGSESFTVDQTLAGTRIRTDLRDLAASVSTFSNFFLREINVTGQESLLVYTVSTEVGGRLGNFSGLGNTGNLSENLVAPHTNTRVRGLSAADNTRDYFRSDVPWDEFNVEAVTLQRGPNSVLFGVAGPAGVVNTSLKRAMFVDKYKVENQFNQFGRNRNIVDLNKELIDDKMAVRLIGLNDRDRYRQDQAYRNTERYYGTLSYNPQIFGGDSSPLYINMSAETGKIRANMPRFTPPHDRVSAFFDPNKLNRQVFHPQAAWAFGFLMDRGTRVNPNYPNNWQPWVGQAIPGLGGSHNTAIIDGVAGGVVQSYQQMTVSTPGGINSTGAIVGGIDGFQNMIRLASVANYQEYVQNRNGGWPGTYPGASSLWKDTVLTDTRIFDFYNNLIDGDNKREWTDFDTYNISFSQTFWQNRFGLEYFHDFQKLSRGGEQFYGNTLSLDINSHLFHGANPANGQYLVGYDWSEIPLGDPAGLANPVGGFPNPNVGRAFVSGQGSASELRRERENNRFTGFLDLKATDFMREDSLLARLIGRHTITGLWQEDAMRTNNRSWLPFVMGMDWVSAVPAMDPNLNGYYRRIPYMVYLSGDLRTANLANGLGLTPPNFRFSPTGTISAGFFDSTWNPPEGVSPGDPWITPINGEESTQSENPDNYVGWRTGNFTVLNANAGDIDSLYISASQIHETIRSKGVTWQARLLDNHIIGTVGYRRDEVTTVSQIAPIINQQSRAVDPFFRLTSTPDNTTTAKGSMSTWGIVARSPKFINEALPFIDNLTVFYNESENFSAERRFGFDAMDIPPPSGTSRDVGFTVSALDRKLNLRATWYKTEQKNASIPGGNPLGGNSWYLANNYVWNIGHALRMEAIHRGEGWAGFEWYYNYAWVDDGYVEYGMPPEGLDHPSLARQQAMIAAVYAQLLPQEWFDAYGYPVNVAALQSPDWNVRRTGITDPIYRPGTTNNVVSLQPSGNGLIQGLSPTGTIDQISEGFELELNAQLTNNWNLHLNASKTKAARGGLGPEFVNFLTFMRNYYDSPAGEIRQWWAGDPPGRQYFDDFIWLPYLFQTEAEGLPAAEIRPWRFNAVTSYRFTEGRFAGARVGVSYRWQDDVILGNRLNDALDNLDPNKPIYGGSEANVDMWVGYNRNLTNRINWDVQVNVRNVGTKKKLIPVSVNPDGGIAAQRVFDGMVWEIRNSFSF